MPEKHFYGIKKIIWNKKQCLRNTLFMTMQFSFYLSITYIPIILHMLLSATKCLFPVNYHFCSLCTLMPQKLAKYLYFPKAHHTRCNKVACNCCLQLCCIVYVKFSMQQSCKQHCCMQFCCIVYVEMLRAILLHATLLHRVC